MFMAQEASKMLNIDVDDLKLITCHLGNGASVTAIKHGRSFDTSMGYTPLGRTRYGNKMRRHRPDDH